MQRKIEGIWEQVDTGVGGDCTTPEDGHCQSSETAVSNLHCSSKIKASIN